MRGAIVFLGVALIVSPALGQNFWDGVFARDGERGFQRERRQHGVRKPRVVRRESSLVISSARAWQGCMREMTAHGDQALTEDGAKAEARKGWMQAVRFRHGEMFADFKNAERASYACVRSSIGSVAGQVLNRCELTAIPCAPRPTSD